jgi:DNA polymerase III sliding clamp (beta) subunit (PCNA family)
MLISSNFFKRLVRAVFNAGVYEAKVIIASWFSVTAVNSSNTMLVHARVPVEDNDEHIEVVLDFGQLYDILNVLKSEKISIDIEDEKLVLRSNRLTYRVKTLSEEWSKVKKYPELDYTAEVKISFEDFRDAIKFCDKIGDHVIFEVDNKIFRIICESYYLAGDGKAEFEFEGGTGKASAKYGLDFLSNILRGGKTGDEIIIRFSSDKPAEFEFISDDYFELRYILAPRIDTEV